MQVSIFGGGTGTALGYSDIDFSALVPKTYMGAANGVATLDVSGKLPPAVMKHSQQLQYHSSVYGTKIHNSCEQNVLCSKNV